MADKTHHFRALDGWRGLCALLVALYHFPGTGALETHPLVRHADLFVDFFFVLSGFVIAANYVSRLPDRRAAGEFLWLRIGRLWPLHAVLLLGFICVELMQAARGGVSFNGMSEQGALLTNALLIHSWGLHDQITWNWPSWSISCELAAYCAFALITLAAGRARWWVYAGLIALSLSVLWYFAGGKYLSTWDFGVWRCFAGFFAGVFAWRAWKSLAQRASTLSRRAATLIEFAGAGLAIAFVWNANMSSLHFAAPLVFFLSVLAFSFDGGWLSRFLHTRPFAVLGLLSYSIYMVHAFLVMRFENVMTVLEGKLGRSLHAQDTLGHDVYTVPGMMPELVSLAFLALTVAVSWFTYRLIEVPGRDFFRNRLKPRRA